LVAEGLGNGQEISLPHLREARDFQPRGTRPLCRQQRRSPPRPVAGWRR
jgi:hypothetical protein